VLPAPTFALNARVRGGLLHGALEAFWRQRGLVELQGMDLAMRAREIDLAVNASLAKFNSTAMDELAPRLALLEAERLRTLMAIWLDVEAQRSNFRVIACEERQTLEIEGLPVRVVIDRVDELDDGRLVVIDYKSGRSVSVTSCADLRPSEPQLPIYASLAFPDRAVAAVALARVVADEPAFLGVAEIDGLLPGVNALEGQRLRYAEDQFPDWESLRRLWGERIAEIAREVRNGCAAVVFSDEKAIQFCAVKPLLRVAERTAQWEDQS
jgi:exodeoxyribonuclease-5